MPQKEPKDIGALLEELKQKPGYSDPRVKAVLDEEIPKLVALHKANNEEGLLKTLREIQQKVDGILKPVPAGPTPPLPSGVPPAGPPPATEPEPPEGPNPAVPELDDTVPESFEGMSDAEVIQDLMAQYVQRVMTLYYCHIVASLVLPQITDINGQVCRAPTFAEIKSKLLTPEFLQKIRQFKRPMLLLTPIGMSLNDLAVKVGGKRGRLAEHNPVFAAWDLDADIVEDLVYFPQRYDKDNHGGVTKVQLLAQTGGKNMFPGWTVTVVEGMDQIDLEAIKINPPPTDSGVSKYKNAHQFLQETKAAGLSGLTPEEWLMLHAEGVRRGKPFESQYWTWLLAVYHKALVAVPNPNFNPGDARAYMRLDLPELPRGHLGVRRAARG